MNPDDTLTAPFTSGCAYGLGQFAAIFSPPVSEHENGLDACSSGAGSNSEDDKQ